MGYPTLKVLVTGSNGFIGYNVVRRLEFHGHDVVGIDNQTGYNSINSEELKILHHERNSRKKTISKVFDIRSEYIDKVFAYFKPDVVIHFASLPRQEVAKQDPLLASDVMTNGLINVLESSKQHKIKKFVYISSSMVYGKFEDGTDESKPCNPQGIYAILKLGGEKLVADYQGHFDYTIIRPSAVYGEYDSSIRVIGQFFVNAIRDQKLTVYGPKEILDFTHVDDCSKGIYQAVIGYGKHNIYNITRSADKPITLLNAAEKIVSMVGKGTIQTKDRNLEFPSRGRLNIARAKKDFEYDPKIDFDEGLLKTYEWFEYLLSK